MVRGSVAGRVYDGLHWARGYSDYVNTRMGSTRAPTRWEDNGNVTHLTAANFHRPVAAAAPCVSGAEETLPPRPRLSVSRSK